MAEPCQQLGESLSTPRIYLTGHVLLEYGDRVVTERDLPGRQGRVAFVFLTANRSRPISRSELVGVIWPDQPPQDTETGLSVILSKLRATLKKMGWPSNATIDVHSRSVGIRLPPQTWIDIEEAANAIDEADGRSACGRSSEGVGIRERRREYCPPAVSTRF